MVMKNGNLQGPIKASPSINASNPSPSSATPEADGKLAADKVVADWFDAFSKGGAAYALDLRAKETVTQEYADLAKTKGKEVADSYLRGFNEALPAAVKQAATKQAQTAPKI